MAEIVLGPDDDRQEVTAWLLENAGDVADVRWAPRPDTGIHGGVYVVPDELASAYEGRGKATRRKASSSSVPAADVDGSTQGRGGN